MHVNFTYASDSSIEIHTTVLVLNVGTDNWNVNCIRI